MTTPECKHMVPKNELCPICTLEQKAASSCKSELLCCPYCGNDPEYMKGTDSQADAIYCTSCPLGVEFDGMSYNALAMVWNGLPRTT